MTIHNYEDQLVQFYLSRVNMKEQEEKGDVSSESLELCRCWPGRAYLFSSHEGGGGNFGQVLKYKADDDDDDEPSPTKCLTDGRKDYILISLA